MFDIGFSELLLVFVIGLIVLGPQRLPTAVKTVVGWIRAVRSLAANVQHELAQELKLQELQDGLKKVEEETKGTLSPELKESIQELRKTAESVKRSYHESIENERLDDQASHSEATHAAENQPPAVSSRLITPEQECQAQQHQAQQAATSIVTEHSLNKDESTASRKDNASCK